MITITGTLSKGWMNQALGVTFDRDYYFDPVKRHAVDGACNDYAAQSFPDIMALFYSESNLGRRRYWDPSQVLIGGIQPNMILGMLLGAEFVPAEDRDADITPAPLAGSGPEDLPAPEALLDHDLIRLFDDQIARCRQAGRALRPIPPFFWDGSGRAAIHGVVTSAHKLYGEAIFLDLVTGPDKCSAIMRWIAAAYTVLSRHFAETADLPIADVHVGECSACMIGPAPTERFVVPATSRIGRTLGPVRLHSCGPSTHLLEAFARIEALHSLDLGGETSIARAREIFGPEMPISIAPLPADMAAEATEPIIDWAGRILDENAAGPLEFVYHLETAYNPDTIEALTQFLSRQKGFRSAPG